MAGNKSGGLKAAQTNINKYGEDFYRIQGRKGGSVRHPETRAFNRSRLLAAVAGRKGGKISRRPKTK